MWQSKMLSRIISNIYPFLENKKPKKVSLKALKAYNLWSLSINMKQFHFRNTEMLLNFCCKRRIGKARQILTNFPCSN